MYNNFGQNPQLFSQPTGQSGYAQKQQQFQQPLYAQQTGFQQPQPTGFQQAGLQQTGYQPQQQFNQFQQPQQFQQPLQPQATGFYSAAQQVEKNDDLKIPNIRLSFITAVDQQKYEQLFRSAVAKDSNSINADAARDILMRSGLQPQQLAKIWELSDLNKSGRLLFPEFALSLYLVNVALTTRQLPYNLDGKIKGEVEGFVDAINFTIPDKDNTSTTPFDNINSLNGLQFSIPVPTGGIPSLPPTSFLQPQITGYQPLQPQGTGYLQSQNTGYKQQGLLQQQATGFGQPMQAPPTGFPQPLLPNSTGYQQLQPQITGYQQLQPQSTGYQQLQPQNTGYQKLQPQQTGFVAQPLMAQKTGVGNNQFFQSSLLQPQRTGFQNLQQYAQYENQEFIKPQERQLFSKIFDSYDKSKSGQLDGATCSEIFRKSGLNRGELEKVWNLVNTADKSFLTKETFSLGMWLIYKKLNGHQLPNILPPSLVPNSQKVLDDVKEKLKLSTPAFSRPFGASSFQNNDSDQNTSNKRRDPVQDPSSDLEMIRAKIEQKKSELELLYVPSPVGTADTSAIESLKSRIRSLPKVQVTGDRLQLKDRLNSLTTKVPSLIREISRIDNEISNSRIELYRIQNPMSIVGSGPNGEVTESDKRKAKSKAVLAQRMAALTGKPVVDTTAEFEEQQRKLDAEVSKIKAGNKQNQEIIYDIEKSIKDLSSGAQSSLNQDGDAAAYRKFELGVDVQPEVAALVKELRTASSAVISAPELVAQPQTALTSQKSYSAPASNGLLKEASPVTASTSPASESYSNFQTAAERAAYIKEQAKKRMNEKLAKFGIHRKGQPEPARSPPATSVESPAAQSQPVPLPSQGSTSPVDASAPLVTKSTPPQVVKAPPPPPVRSSTKISQVEDDDEDEEERKLREQLEALKLKKKTEKEARMAELRRQLEEEENDDEHDQTTQVKTFTPQPAQAAAVKQDETTPAPAQHHDTNPFVKKAIAATDSSTNPFGKPRTFQDAEPATKPAFDQSKIAAQRAAQRGEDDDDGWSDEDDKGADSEDEALPNRQGAAQLAGLLFSGMGPGRTDSFNSQLATPKEATPTAKPTPIAAPIPSVSTPAKDTAVQLVHLTAPIENGEPSTQEGSYFSSVADSLPDAISSPQITQADAPAVPLAPPIPHGNTSTNEPTPPLPQGVAAAMDMPSDSQREGSEEFQTPTASSPATESSSFAPPPSFPQMDAPPAPGPPRVPSIPQAPRFSAPPPPPLPEIPSPSAPSPPPLQQSTSLPPPALPASEAPPPPALPSTEAPPPPALPSTQAHPPPALPSTEAPPPPPPPAPALTLASSNASVTPAPPAAGGLPFLSQIQQRRDERFVVE